MSGPLLFRCHDADERRALVAGHPTLNAIDHVEVGDLDHTELDAGQQVRYQALPPGRGRDRLLWQRSLTLTFVNPLKSDQRAALVAGTIRLTGGERVRGITLDVIDDGPRHVVLRASRAGDFSTYTLDLVRSLTDPRPPAGFDPVLSWVDLSFKVDCPTDADCRGGHTCLPPRPAENPRIDYLAKDYASFRRVILDRLALLVPDWRDRTPADLGMTLVELLAYLGDHLSYEQDAVATEAYLGTARLRTSVRRHVALVDHAMHDGCNARVWVHLHVDGDVVVDPAALRFLTGVAGLPPRVASSGDALEAALGARAEWFEPMVPEPPPGEVPAKLHLFADHNQLRLYPWAASEYALPRGAVGAALSGHHPALAPGMVLLLEEVRGPRTGHPGDADRRHRHAVRLTAAEAFEDGARRTDPLTGAEITEVAWATADALPFDLCVRAPADPAAGRPALEDVSIASGNVVLADHGRTVAGEGLGVARAAPERFRPRLAEAPLTATTTVRLSGRRVRHDPVAPASTALTGAPALAVPAIVLDSTLDAGTTRWRPARDLLDSPADEPDFVVESEADGAVTLRFGLAGHRHGRPPRAGERFTATYRVGNGPVGNVGADAIGHVVTANAGITSVRNPLPAAGGTGPETIEEARRHAPQAFRTQERAVTPADYEELLSRRPDVQRAAATLRWTGSWHTVFLTVDRAGSLPVDDAYEADLVRHLERYRLAGHDLEVDAPRFVALELHLAVCVREGYFRSDVEEQLRQVLSSRTLPDGRLGLFHADRFTFGQTVHLSPVIAAAREVPGVESVRVTRFRPLGERGSVAPRVELGRLEIARLDADPDFPEHGVLGLALSGGK